MNGLDDAADAVQALISDAEDDPVTGHQTPDGAAQVTPMYCAIAVLDIGMLTKTADD